MTARLRSERGFTLLEALVALSILAIVLPAVALVLTTGIRWSDSIQEESVAQTEVRATLDRLAADLRQAFTGDPTPVISEATSTTLTFYSPDRGTPFHLRRISYRLVGGRFERSLVSSTNAGAAPWTFPGAPATWMTELRNVRNATAFVYRDASGAATTDPVAVHSVVVSLTLPVGVGDARAATYGTSVTVRGS